MDDFGAALIAGAFYKSAIICSGTYIVRLGFALYSKGVLEATSEFEAKSGDWLFVLRRVGPGVLFALFGAAVIMAGIWKGLNVEVPGKIMMNTTQRVPALENDLPQSLEPSPAPPPR